MAEENFDRAIALLEEAVTVARSGGHNAAGSVGNLGYIALLQGDYERARTLSEEATGLFRDRGHQSGVAMGMAFVADAELRLGHAAEARIQTRNSLRYAEELGFTEVIAMSLDTSAALLAEDGHAGLAARLMGVADALRDEIGVRQTPAERRLHERADAAVTASLGADEFVELRAAGRTLDAKDAVGLALATLD